MMASYLPTKGMVTDAERGLEWRREHGRGGTEVGIARARDITNGKRLSESTVKRMHSFFARHEVDKKAEGFRPGEKGYPSNGRIAWALWGGDAGFTWSKGITDLLKKDDKERNIDETLEKDLEMSEETTEVEIEVNETEERHVVAVEETDETVTVTFEKHEAEAEEAEVEEV